MQQPLIEDVCCDVGEMIVSELEKPIDFIQSAFRKTPTVVVLGSGASVPAGLPTMGDLASHLEASISPSASEQATWDGILADLAAGMNFEDALSKVEAGSELRKLVVAETWKLINSKDREAFAKSLVGPPSPLAHLIAHLTATSGRTLDIVTTNYDRQAEYAAERAESVWFDGFGPGHFRSFVGEVGSDAQWSYQAVRKRTVRIWKVHGSLDWFAFDGGAIAALVRETDIPSDATPLIVTPGRNKYEESFREPFRTMISVADRVMSDARTVFCLGYGFNDQHVQEKLKARRGDGGATFVIVTFELTEATKKFLAEGNCQRYIAIESRTDPTGKPTLSKIRMKEGTADELVMDTNEPSWKFDHFIKYVVS